MSMTSTKNLEVEQMQAAAVVIDSRTLSTGWAHRYPKYGFQFQRLQVQDRPWHYRGEGNSKIVLAFEDDLRVVRLSKVKVDERCPEDWRRQKRKVEREVVFANHAFGPIIGLEFVGSVRPVQLSSGVIQEINESIRSIRPEYRLHKELGVPYATSHTDFARIHSFAHPSSNNPDFCVEIKAKQGSWSKLNLGGISTLCTYCLNQFLKLSTGKITRRSNYCPLDLFSGNPNRMIRSVIDLVENPQNNFRIFRDGALVYGEHCYESLESILQEWISPPLSGNESPSATSTSSDLHNMLYLICMALIKPQQSPTATGSAQKMFMDLKRDLGQFLSQPNLTEVNDLNPRSGCSCSADSASLPEGSILSRILSAQMLGKWSSGSIYNLFRKICPYHTTNPKTSDTDCPSTKCMEEEIWLDELDESQIMATMLETLSIERYLLAATAKDCSIMITFSKISDEDRIKKRRRSVPSMVPEDGENFWILDDLNGSSYRVRIGVADMDPKPITAIARHYFRDLEMIRAHQAIMNKAAGCDV